MTPRTVLATALVFVFALSSEAGAEPRRVLLLHSFDRETAPFSDFSAALRKDLSRLSPASIDLYEASLETARFTEGEDERPFVGYLSALFRARKLDLIITIGAPAARFFQRYRTQLFPSTPMLISASEQRLIDTTEMTANDAAIGVTLDLKKIVDNILWVLPQTTSIAIMVGDSPIDRYWAAEIQRAWRPFSGRVQFIWLNKLSHDEALNRVASLPPRSAIFYGDYWADVDGVPYPQDQILQEIRTRANAPIFSYIDAYFGRGIVGGPLIPIPAMSKRTAEVAVRILSGEPPGSIKTQPFELATPVFDARELQRWRIAEKSLPPGSSIEFREPTALEKYRWQILVVTFVLLAEGGAIAWLLFERRQRRLAELELRRRALEVIHLNRVAATGALSASIAHELNQPLAAVLSNADAAELLLDANPPDIGQVRDVLDHIRVANGRAAEIVERSRKLLKRRTEIELQEFDLNETIASAVDLLLVEARKRSVRLETDGIRRPLRVRADQIHMQQVIFNLVMNGMDAMASIEGDVRKIVVQTALAGDTKVEVSVIDSGAGIPKEKLNHVFDAFYTTKEHGTGLGLSIARTIIEAYGGRIWAENRAGSGAVFRFTMPLIGPSAA